MPKTLDLKDALGKLKRFYGEWGRLPSYAEIGELCGYASKGGVAHLVDQLVEKKWLEKDPKGRLLPTAALEGGVKVLGTIQAGFPSPAEEELVDTLSLDEFLITNPESSYLVKVSGDSMTDAGILPGDLVIVDRGRQPKSGDIVIAQVDGEWTMKFFHKENGKVVLRAGNKKYPPIHPKNELVVRGVVTANVRKYK